jgi:hypothetical protein
MAWCCGMWRRLHFISYDIFGGDSSDVIASHLGKKKSRKLLSDKLGPA